MGGGPPTGPAGVRQIDGTSDVLTGDWATVDADDTIILLGRGSSCINSGGGKIYPIEVEEALERHEGVDDCLLMVFPMSAWASRSWPWPAAPPPTGPTTNRTPLARTLAPCDNLDIVSHNQCRSRVGKQ